MENPTHFIEGYNKKPDYRFCCGVNTVMTPILEIRSLDSCLSHTNIICKTIQTVAIFKIKWK